jgi:hypothetical protein
LAESNAPADYSVELRWLVQKARWKALYFGVLSSVAALGLACAKLATENLSPLTITNRDYWFGAVSIGLVGVTAGLFYLFFNKK